MNAIETTDIHNKIYDKLNVALSIYSRVAFETAQPEDGESENFLTFGLARDPEGAVAIFASEHTPSGEVTQSWLIVTAPPQSAQEMSDMAAVKAVADGGDDDGDAEVVL